MPPVFLNLGEILDIHRDQIERYGGDPAIRDLTLLRSALAMPTAGVGDGYLHNDLFEMASAYLFHLIGNHPFIDGNKRTGAVAALVFLSLNGIEIEVDEDSFEALVRSVAEGRTSKPFVAEFFRRHAVP